MSTPVTLAAGTLDSTCYPASAQTYFTNLVGKITATLADTYQPLLIQAALPSADQQGYAWLKLNADGTPTYLYRYQGQWLCQHEVPASGNERRIWVGTENQLWSYDGGDGTDPAAATTTTGSFWAVDLDFSFRVPMGAGTNGTAYNGDPATVLAVGGTAGAEMVTLVPADCKHKHCFGRMQADTGDDADDPDLLTGSTTLAAGAARGVSGDTSGIQTKDINTDTGEFLVTAESEVSTASDAHQNLPPVRGVYIIKRSSRVYRTV